MLKYATIIAPLLLRLGTPNPVKAMRGHIGVFLLICLSVVFFLAALFTWIASNYALDIAFLTIAIILLVIAISINIKGRIAKKNALQAAIDRDAEITGMLAAKADPLSEYIPDDILMNPFVKKILAQIEERPFLASLVAVILGMILSNQFLDSSE